jgi:hypothetical protein
VRRSTRKSNSQGKGVLVIEDQTSRVDVEAEGVPDPVTIPNMPVLVRSAILESLFFDDWSIFVMIMSPHGVMVPAPSVRILRITIDHEFETRFVFGRITLRRWQLKLKLFHMNNVSTSEFVKVEDHTSTRVNFSLSPGPGGGNGEPFFVSTNNWRRYLYRCKREKKMVRE